MFFFFAPSLFLQKQLKNISLRFMYCEGRVCVCVCVVLVNAVKPRKKWSPVYHDYEIIQKFDKWDNIMSVQHSVAFTIVFRLICDINEYFFFFPFLLLFVLSLRTFLLVYSGRKSFTIPFRRFVFILTLAHPSCHLYAFVQKKRKRYSIA